ncbi:MAG: zf-HC2 domain-containing protein [Dehalococcoidia bacterium]
MKNLLPRRHTPDIEALSAFLDGGLEAAQARALEAHLASCDVCSGRLDVLRALRAALRELPEAETPRSFRLRRADIEAPAPAAAAAPGWMRLAPALSALSVLVFAVLVGVDLSRGGGSSGQSGLTAAGAGQDQLQASRSLETSMDADTSKARTADDDAGAPAAGGPDVGETATEAYAEATALAQAAPAGAVAPPVASEDPDAATLADDAALIPASQPTPAGEQDNDESDLLLRTLEIASAAVALGAAAIALISWTRRRREA